MSDTTPTNWWRRLAILFAGLAAWNCSKTQDAEERYSRENSRAAEYEDDLQKACQRAQSCSDCDLGRVCR